MVCNGCVILMTPAPCQPSQVNGTFHPRDEIGATGVSCSSDLMDGWILLLFQVFSIYFGIYAMWRNVNVFVQKARDNTSENKESSTVKKGRSSLHVNSFIFYY